MSAQVTTAMDMMSTCGIRIPSEFAQTNTIPFRFRMMSSQTPHGLVTAAIAVHHQSALRVGTGHGRRYAVPDLFRLLIVSRCSRTV